MIEPVAYRASERKGDRWLLFNQKPTMNVYEVIEPLYTAEQLQPHVKMTQAEFDEFKSLLSVGISTIYEAFDLIDSDRGEMDEFEQLYNRLFTDSVSVQAKSQIEFSKLWDSLTNHSPEEMIDIIPDMKWFVRSKRYKDYFLRVTEDFVTDPYTNKEQGKMFDTKEEADEWVTPVTESVKLPVEDK